MRMNENKMELPLKNELEQDGGMTQWAMNETCSKLKCMINHDMARKC
jgi:hypothetical protein